jgi:aspartyl-tRNA(Asn)/glutamyl-tRNA(Gln) amidotransferase subunit A
MDTIGPLTRTVEDCAITLQAITGFDANDPYTSTLPVPDYRQTLDGNIKGTRIGVIKEIMYSDMVQPEVHEAVSQAVHVLGGLGASVEEISIPLTGQSRTISDALRIEAPTNSRELMRHRLQEIGHDNRIQYLTWSCVPALAYYKAQKLRALLRQQLLQALEKVDVLLTPTSGIPALKIVPGSAFMYVAGPIDSKEKAGRNPWMLTTAFSLGSKPALSICCGFTSLGLPIGLQLGGSPFQEETLLKVAHAYEQNTPWHTQRPAL